MRRAVNKVFKRILHYFIEFVFVRWLMRPGPSDDIRSVLISAYTGLGHMVIKTVLIRKIEELYPSCKIFLIADDAIQNVFPYSGHIGTQHLLPQYPFFKIGRDSSFVKMVVFFLKLRKKGIDAVLLPFDASPKILIRGCIIAGIPIRVGHFFSNDTVPSYYYTHKVPIERQQVRNEVDLNLDLLEALSKKGFERDYYPIVRVDYKSTILEDNLLTETSYICIQMGGKSGHATPTRWIESHWQRLIEKLVSTYSDLRIVALGDLGDSVIVNRICKTIQSSRVVNVSCKSSLGDTMVLISGCQLVICHDSGILHLANALQKEVIAIYGPTEPDFYAVNLPTCRIIQKKCDCPKPGPGLFPGIFEPTEEEYASKCPFPMCMERITVDDVYEKCVEILEKSGIMPTHLGDR